MNCYFNKRLTGADNIPFTLDLYEPESLKDAPVVVFIHGFKGFKDWGHWHRIAERFATEGFVFIKFNFSHNGVQPDTPTTFSDLEAFGQNNFSKELFDLQRVLDFVYAQKAAGKLWDVANLSLIGHSRGGPIALITALDDERVKQVVTWASVHELDYSWEEEADKVKSWGEKGVQHIVNGRTKQEMPLYFQLYEDFEAHKERYRLKNRLPDLDKPVLIVHGAVDPAISKESAKYLHHLIPNSVLRVVEEADHVFGGHHPYTDRALPKPTEDLLHESITFLNAQ